jgi:hypothetical protein
MNSLQKHHGKGIWSSSLLGIVLFLILLMQSRMLAQSVSEWTIPASSPPNIQGLDALAPENPYKLVYFTEYATFGKIGMLTGISSGNALLSEWLR